MGTKLQESSTSSPVGPVEEKAPVEVERKQIKRKKKGKKSPKNKKGKKKKEDAASGLKVENSRSTAALLQQTREKMDVDGSPTSQSPNSSSPVELMLASPKATDNDEIIAKEAELKTKGGDF